MEEDNASFVSPFSSSQSSQKLGNKRITILIFFTNQLVFQPFSHLKAHEKYPTNLNKLTHTFKIAKN
jgi:hypothetical protein